MCNIAGYVGNQPAAPILLEMLRRQEGLAGGYYTGIATIHEGKMYYAKLTGDVKRLEENTEAAKLPGTIGIIHSRSKSGGGDSWAHPFVRCQKGEVTEAYVANGSVGCMAHRMEEFNQMAWQLLQEGYTMDSKLEIVRKGYPVLPDGSGVHMSDVMCQLIARYMDKGKNVAEAMGEAFCEMPSEIVGLMLSLTDPNGIAWSRFNMPMNVAFASHGAYLASAAIAMPEDAGEPMPLMPCAYGVVYADHFTTHRYENSPLTVAQLTAEVRGRAFEVICRELEEGPKYYGELHRKVKELFEPADCMPSTLATYEVLYALKKAGKLKVESETVEGAFEHLTAPKFVMHMV